MPKKGKSTKTKIMKQSQKVNIYLDKSITKRKPAKRRAPGQTIKRGMNMPQPIVVNVPQYTNFQPQMPQPQPMFAQMPGYNKGAENYFNNAIRQSQIQEDKREAKQVEAKIMPKIVAEPEEIKAIIPQQQEPDIKREIPMQQEIKRAIPKATNKPPSIRPAQSNQLTRELKETLEEQEFANKMDRAQDIMNALEETRNIIKDTKAKKKEVEMEAIAKAKAKIAEAKQKKQAQLRALFQPIQQRKSIDMTKQFLNEFKEPLKVRKVLNKGIPAQEKINEIMNTVQEDDLRAYATKFNIVKTNTKTEGSKAKGGYLKKEPLVRNIVEDVKVTERDKRRQGKN